MPGPRLTYPLPGELAVAVMTSRPELIEIARARFIGGEVASPAEVDGMLCLTRELLEERLKLRDELLRLESDIKTARNALETARDAMATALDTTLEGAAEAARFARL